MWGYIELVFIVKKYYGRFRTIIFIITLFIFSCCPCLKSCLLSVTFCSRLCLCDVCSSFLCATSNQTSASISNHGGTLSLICTLFVVHFFKASYVTELPVYHRTVAAVYVLLICFHKLSPFWHLLLIGLSFVLKSYHV